MSAALPLVDLVGGGTAGPDGYVRLAVDADTWAALAAVAVRTATITLGIEVVALTRRRPWSESAATWRISCA